MLVAIAGRVARAYIAETPGVYRPSWSIEEVGAQIDAIRDTSDAGALPGGARRPRRPHPVQLRDGAAGAENASRAVARVCALST